MKTFNITLPIGEKQIIQLRAGDFLLLNGFVYRLRDAAHKRIESLLIEKKPLPFELKNAAIYYTGPTPSPGKNMVFGAAGPTTSDRMDKYTPRLLKEGVKIMIGKGKRGIEVVKAIEENKALYLATIGGAGSYLAGKILSSKVIAFEELGTEAIRLLEIKDFPCIVINDTHGNDYYRKVLLTQNLQ